VSLNRTAGGRGEIPEFASRSVAPARVLDLRSSADAVDLMSSGDGVTAKWNQTIDLDQVLEDFERAMLRQSVLPSTVRVYRWALQDLFEALKSAGVRDARQLSQAMLREWQATMAAREWRPSTANLATNSVRRFIFWANDSGLVDLDLAESLSRLKAPQSQPRWIPRDDLERITAYLLPRRPRMSLLDLRDRALFIYLLTTGAPISEAIKDRREGLVSEDRDIHALPMPPIAYELVLDYLRGRNDRSPWLWIGHKTNGPVTRLGPTGVLYIWLRLAQQLELTPWSTRQLQNTACPPKLLVPNPTPVRSIELASPRKAEAAVTDYDSHPFGPTPTPAWFTHVAAIWTTDTLEERPINGRRRYHLGRGTSWMARSLGRVAAVNPIPLEQAVAVWDQDFYLNGGRLGLKTADAIHWMVPAIAEWGRSKTSTSTTAQRRWDSALESWAALSGSSASRRQLARCSQWIRAGPGPTALFAGHRPNLPNRATRPSRVSH
jgi:integrase